MSDDTITTQDTYDTDLAEAVDIVADTLAELDHDHEQIAKSINDALNNSWTEGVTVPRNRATHQEGGLTPC